MELRPLLLEAHHHPGVGPRVRRQASQGCHLFTSCSASQSKPNIRHQNCIGTVTRGSPLLRGGFLKNVVPRFAHLAKCSEWRSLAPRFLLNFTVAKKRGENSGENKYSGARL